MNSMAVSMSDEIDGADESSEDIQQSLSGRPRDAAGNILADAFEAYRTNSSQGPDAVLSAFYGDTRVKRIQENVVRSFNLFEVGDELLQRVASLFWEKLLPLMLSVPNEPDNVYKVVYAAARNVGLSLRKERTREAMRHVHPSESDDEEPGTDALPEQLDDWLSTVDARLDQERAGAELERRIAMHSKTYHPLIEIHRLPPAKPVPPKPAKVVPADGEKTASVELAEIRDSLGVTNDKFAGLLNIGQPRLLSYLYRRVQNVPLDIMKAARDLLEDGPRGYQRAVARFADKEMPEIVATWESLLGITGDATADEQIAKILGVNRVTVWRWRNDKGRPTVHEISEHDLAVRRRVDPAVSDVQ